MANVIAICGGVVFYGSTTILPRSSISLHSPSAVSKSLRLTSHGRQWTRRSKQKSAEKRNFGIRSDVGWTSAAYSVWPNELQFAVWVVEATVEQKTSRCWSPRLIMRKPCSTRFSSAELKRRRFSIYNKSKTDAMPMLYRMRPEGQFPLAFQPMSWIPMCKKRKCSTSEYMTLEPRNYPDVSYHDRKGLKEVIKVHPLQPSSTKLLVWITLRIDVSRALRHHDLC